MLLRCCDAALVGGVVVEVALHSYDYFWKTVDVSGQKQVQQSIFGEELLVTVQYLADYFFGKALSTVEKSAMAQLVAKLVGWFAEHIIVASLSRSKRFQNLALWIDHHITHKKQIVEEKTKNVTSQAGDFAKTFKKVLEEETKSAVQASNTQHQAQMKAQSTASSTATSSAKTASPPPSASASSSTTSSTSSSSGGYSSGRYTNSPSNRVDRIR